MKPWAGKKTIIGGLIAVLVIGAILLFLPGRTRQAGAELTTYSVTRGRLVIDVLESGSVESSESQQIKSRVEGMTTIIFIVPEGTIVTEQDVEEKKLLVELDSSALQQKAVQQEISVQNAQASYTEAKETYDIQMKQNESNLRQGELKVKFARMDIERYLGEDLAELFIGGKVELMKIPEHEALGGEALQKARRLRNDIQQAEENKALAEDKVTWSRTLESKGYVTRSELQADEMTLNRHTISLEQSITALELYKKYELPKDAEKLRSDYLESHNELERIQARNRAEISKAEARLRSTEATYNSQKDQLDKLKEQIENCRIYATSPGMVVYAGSNEPWRGDRIQEGAQVRERQNIIEIPNTSSMVVKARVHESVITRVREGQRAFITIDAMPNLTLEGKVNRVGILPDSQNRWLSPNLKVYQTDVAITGEHPELKPGMSSQVRIITNELEDVLMVPLQAVTTRGDDSICFVLGSTTPQLRVIKAGEYNDQFIEIREGLKEGEKVVLNPSHLNNRGKMPQELRRTPPTAATASETEGSESHGDS